MSSVHAGRMVVAARALAERAAGTELEKLAGTVLAEAEAVERHCTNVQQALTNVLVTTAVAASCAGVPVAEREDAVGERIDAAVRAVA